MNFINQLFSILIGPEGTLFFHLILAFAVMATLQGAYAQWRATEFPQTRRMVLGLTVLIATQAMLFLVSALALQGFGDPRVILPPLDRAVMFISLVWAVWLWAFPEPVKNGDAATVLLNLLVLVGLVFGIFTRSQSDPALPYNTSVDSLVWGIFSLGYILIGGIILIRRQPAGWSYGLALLGFALVGHLIDALFPELGSLGNYSSVLRLAYIAAFQFLPTLTQRYPSPATATATTQPKKVTKAGVDDESERPFRERRRYSADPKTLHALLTLAAEVDANKISDDLTRAVAQIMLADLCFIVYPSDDKRHLIFASGYDLIREEHLPGTFIDKDVVPMLATAILKGKSLRLPASTTSADLKGLGDVFGLVGSQGAGNLLSVPIAPINDKGNPSPSVLMLSPYSDRVWSAEDQSFLNNHTASLLPVLERGQRVDKLEKAKERSERSLQEAYERVTRAESEMHAAKEEADNIREQTRDSRETYEKLLVSTGEVEDLRLRLAAVEGERQALSQTLATTGPNNDQLEQELKLTLQETARLQNALAQAEMKLLEQGSKPASGISGDQAEVIASISQELRQPMSSIVGYADLLLGESVGILGALQRKFIERIKASTERIGSLIDDLIQISTLDSGLKSLKPEAVDLNLIIDNAMAYTSSQLREKNIALRIDIAKTLQPINADREAMQQIMIHLLQNAGAATPVEGTISLRVRTQKENNQDYVLVQISDTGGGIPEADLPRVFSRLYRAENVLIQGVGDTGVGLSIAKALTEAQGGRIWVETEMSVGATFSVLLPITPADKPKEG